MKSGRYPNLVDAISRTPWAIHPAMLAVIIDVVSYRAAGGRLTSDELDSRLEPRAASRASYVAGTVAVIPLQGVLMPKANLFTQISGGTSLQDFCAALREAVGNEQVTQILLDVNSPGGATDMVPETAAVIRQANASKPVTAIANTDAASAAYWLAAQARELVCTPSGMTGSIGVYAAHTDLSAQQEMLGEDTTLISAGPYKTELSPFAPLSAEAKAAVQNVVDQYYAMFVNDVAKGRAVKAADVRNGFGQGRMLTAADALAAGMVDRIATFDETFSRLAGTKPKRTPALPGMGAETPPLDPQALAEWVAREREARSGASQFGDITIVFGDGNTVEDEDVPDDGTAEPRQPGEQQPAALADRSDQPEESTDNHRDELEAWDLSLALSEQVIRKEQ